ncbi:MAG TPA: WhiB family transcriptional regulator [Pseudonocardiaceae bacterium]|nr:WhiB family transcriptional regulator [Pseudonocardiaceae bacterium]
MPRQVGTSESTGTTTEEERQVLTAPCRSHDPDLWFAESPAELERAKQLCAGCPIKAACLDSALTRQEPWGVWGGEIFEHGVVIPRKRPRGRPSKAALERDRVERERVERETAA